MFNIFSNRSKKLSLIVKSEWWQTGLEKKYKVDTSWKPLGWKSPEYFLRGIYHPPLQPPELESPYRASSSSHYSPINSTLAPVSSFAPRLALSSQQPELTHNLTSVVNLASILESMASPAAPPESPQFDLPMTTPNVSVTFGKSEFRTMCIWRIKKKHEFCDYFLKFFDFPREV